LLSIIPLLAKLSFVGSRSTKKRQLKTEIFKGTLLNFDSYQISMTLLDDALLHTTCQRQISFLIIKKTQSEQSAIATCQKCYSAKQYYETKHNTLSTLPSPTQTIDVSSSSPPLRHPTPYDT
jgi:hypothetical protein